MSDTEDFLELDKSNLELIEGIASCHYEYGVARGKLEGEAKAWSDIQGEVLRLYEQGDVDKTTLLVFISERVLTAIREADSPIKDSPALKPTRIHEKAAWKVLKRRLEKSQR